MVLPEPRLENVGFHIAQDIIPSLAELAIRVRPIGGGVPTRVPTLAELNVRLKPVRQGDLSNGTPIGGASDQQSMREDGHNVPNEEVVVDIQAQGPEHIVGYVFDQPLSTGLSEGWLPSFDDTLEQQFETATDETLAGVLNRMPTEDTEERSHTSPQQRHRRFSQKVLPSELSNTGETEYIFEDHGNDRPTVSDDHQSAPVFELLRIANKTVNIVVVLSDPRPVVSNPPAYTQTFPEEPQPVPAQQVPDQPVPDQPVQAQPVPDQPVPAQQVPDQPVPAQLVPDQPDLGVTMREHNKPPEYYNNQGYNRPRSHP